MKAKASAEIGFDIDVHFPAASMPAVKAVSRTSGDASAFVKAALAPGVVLSVSRTNGKVDYGTFIVFVNDDRLAYVRLLEHRGFTIKPALASSENTVVFLDEAGGAFDVAEDSTVALQTAVNALDYWLETGGKTDAVLWADE